MRIILLTVIIMLWLHAVGHADSNPLKEKFVEAMQQYQSQNYDVAIKLFEQTLEIYPNFAPSFNYLGLAHKEKGKNFRKVVWYFKRAIEIDPDYAQAYENLGKVYYALGDYDHAEEYNLKALELDSELVSANLSLGWIYLLGKSQASEAIPHFEKVIQYADIPFANFGLGLAYFKAEKRAQVLEMITALRRNHQEGLALQLERMVRAGIYTPPPRENIMPTISMEERSQLVKDEKFDYPDNAKSSSQPVNLSNSRRKSSSSARNNPSTPAVSSIASRNNQLRRSSSVPVQNKGSGY